MLEIIQNQAGSDGLLELSVGLGASVCIEISSTENGYVILSIAMNLKCDTLLSEKGHHEVRFEFMVAHQSVLGHQ